MTTQEISTQLSLAKLSRIGKSDEARRMGRSKAHALTEVDALIASGHPNVRGRVARMAHETQDAIRIAEGCALPASSIRLMVARAEALVDALTALGEVL
jgi:hypothetical protein